MTETPKRDKILIDSSFLFAQINRRDKYHLAAVTLSQALHQTQIVPDVVLTEVAQMLQTISETAVLRFLDLMASAEFQLEAITKFDLARARKIKAIYATAQLDFVDCCIVAIAERLNVTQICTFDRRDFSIFRPQHTAYFELLP